MSREPVIQRTTHRRESDRYLLQSHALLHLLSRAQSPSVSENDISGICTEVLGSLLSTAESECGFIGDVIRHPDGRPYFRLRGSVGISPEELDMKTLFAEVIKAGRAVVFNGPTVPGLSAARSDIKSFLGLPLHWNRELIGMIGIANRPNGYNDAIVGWLEGFQTTCETLFENLRHRRNQIQAERVIRESEERFRMMTDRTPVMVWVSGPDKLCTFFNRAWLDFTGRAMEQELGDGWAQGVHPDDYRQCMESYGAAFDARKEFKIEYRLRRFDGQYRWILDQGAPRFLPDGSFLGYMGSGIDITDRRQTEEALHRSEAALKESQKDLRLLAGRLLSAQEEERRALARELHDDLSQRLAVVAIETGMLELQPESLPDPVVKKIGEIKAHLMQLSIDVHGISRQLHPTILDDLGLSDAIQSETERFAAREGIPVEFLPTDLPETLPKEVALCLYRIVQEGLRNIAKHSRSKKARISLAMEGDSVLLSVQDFGIGFNPKSAKAKGVGLAGMRERTLLVGGAFTIESREGEGTLIEVRVPVPGGGS